MTVYISRLKIRNFRSCIDTDLHLSPYTALIGRNNCGKSNCLTALQWVVRKASLGTEDFNDINQEVEVIGELVNVQEADLATLEQGHRNRIARYVADGILTIRRTQVGPKIAPVLTVLDPTTGDWVLNPTGIDQAVQALFPEPIRIGAMENAEEDASKAKTTTTIGKLLSAMLSSIRERHQADISPHLDSIVSQMSATGARRFDELGRIDISINEKIADLFPGISIKLDFPVPTLEELIKSGTVRVYEGEGEGRPFGFYGHGAQRAIQMALVRHLAEVKRGDGIDGGATLLLVDEPELYLHPFAVEQIRESLRALASVGYQVVFSTHSGQMVLASDAKNALLMTKCVGAGTTARPRLKRVIEERVPNAEHQMAQLFSLTNSSQILFADRVVLAEGKTELRLLPDIFKAIAGQTLGQASIALVAQSSMNDTKKSMEILGALGLPARAVVDLDFAFRSAAAHGLLSAEDSDIQECKAILARLGSAGTIKIDAQSGLPVSKEAPVSSARAFEIMAAELDAAPHIEALVHKLRAQGIWLWSKGAIEAHVGLSAKREPEWLNFQLRCERDGVANACVDYAGVSELIDWMCEA